MQYLRATSLRFQSLDVHHHHVATVGVLVLRKLLLVVPLLVSACSSHTNSIDGNRGNATANSAAPVDVPGLVTLRHEMRDLLFRGEEQVNRELAEDVIALIRETVFSDDAPAQISIDGFDLVVQASPQRQIAVISLVSQLREQQATPYWVAADLIQIWTDQKLKARLDGLVSSFAPRDGKRDLPVIDHPISFEEADDIIKDAQGSGSRDVRVMCLPPRSCFPRQLCEFVVGKRPKIGIVRTADGTPVDGLSDAATQFEGFKLEIEPEIDHTRRFFRLRFNAELASDASYRIDYANGRFTSTPTGRTSIADGALVMPERSAVVLKCFARETGSKAINPSTRQIRREDLYLIIRCLYVIGKDRDAPALYHRTVE